MLFIHPMWDNEAQRIGKLRCTTTGYALHVIAEYIGIGGFLLLLVMPFVLLGKGMFGTFRVSDWWLMAVPFGVGVISEVVMQLSWLLAWKKGFQYDYDKCEATWIEAGERRSYKNPDYSSDPQSDVTRRSFDD